MADRADTGAREPQDSVSALLQRTQQMRGRAERVLAGAQEPDLPFGWLQEATRVALDVAALTEEVERLAALAAGVGVPPDEWSKTLPTVRGLWWRFQDAVDALREIAAEGDAHNGEFTRNRAAGEPESWAARRAQRALASAAEGRNPNPEPAGVGEARPAEPPHTRATSAAIANANVILDESIAFMHRAEKAEAELSRLREQLDAARRERDEALKLAELSWQAAWKKAQADWHAKVFDELPVLTGALEQIASRHPDAAPGEHPAVDIARAALGVVAAAEQTTDLVSAPHTNREDARGDKEAL